MLLLYQIKHFLVSHTCCLYLSVEMNQQYVHYYLLGLRGVMTAPRVLCLRRRSSHTDRENSRTPAPSIHRETLLVRKADLFTCALAWGEEGDFFYPQPEIRSHGSSNSGPEGCRQNCLTSWSSILWPLLSTLSIPNYKSFEVFLDT
jgi:hypothetical protein